MHFEWTERLFDTCERMCYFLRTNKCVPRDFPEHSGFYPHINQYEESIPKERKGDEYGRYRGVAIKESAHCIVLRDLRQKLLSSSFSYVDSGGDISYRVLRTYLRTSRS